MRRGAPVIPAPRGQGHLRMAVLGLLLAPVLGLSAASCRSADPQADLRDRVEQYLAMKQKREWTGVYEGMLDPEVRKSLKLEDFLRPRAQAMDFVGFEVLEVSPADGQVRVKVDAMVPVLRPGNQAPLMVRKQTEEQQRWVQRDGRWYVHLEG